MSATRKILVAIVSLLILIQFFQPKRNRLIADSTAGDISTVLSVPDSVKQILYKACYDCHSNNTRYPFYSYVQPVGWFLAGHIREGRSNLNFNEFAGYSQRKKVGELGEVTEHIEENTMPLMSYRLIHRDARLSGSEKSLLIRWAKSSADTLSAHQK